MKVTVKMNGGMSVSIPLGKDTASVKTLRELWQKNLPDYKDKKVVFIRKGMPVAKSNEGREMLEDGEEVILRIEDDNPQVNVRIALDNSQKKMTSIDKGKTLADLRKKLDGWPELSETNYFFFSAVGSESYRISKNDEPSIELLADNSYTVKLAGEIASELAEAATHKEIDKEVKQRKKEDELIAEQKAKLGKLMGDMAHGIPANKIKDFEDMAKASLRDFKTADRLINPTFGAAPKFDMTSDFFSFVEDEGMLFDLVNRTGILKGIIVGGAQGEFVQSGFLNIVNYEKPVSKKDSFYASMQTKYLEQLMSAKEK